MPAMAASPSIVANFSWMSGVLVTRLNPSRISLRHSLLVCPEVIPIIDVRRRLYPKLEEGSQQLILITHTSAGVIGLKVDEVRRIVTIPTDAFLPPPPLVRGIRGELLIGVIPHGEEVYLLIDVENILTEHEKAELQEADLKGEE